MAKNVHIPTITRLVRQLMEPQGHKRANMPEHGGWVVSSKLWDMEQGAFISWAHSGTEADGTPSNMVEGRPLSPEMLQIANMLDDAGYQLANLSTSRNFFDVVPDGVSTGCHGCSGTCCTGAGSEPCTC